MDFEYDEQKSESNKIKHGIDFEEAKAIWNDEHSCEFITRSDDENDSLSLVRSRECYGRRSLLIATKGNG